MKAIRRAFILLLVIVCMPSCRLIPLYDPESSVYLRLNIKLNTDVVLNEDIDLEGNKDLREKVHGVMPQTVRACFYNIETHKLVAEEYLPPEGGFVNIPSGMYDIIVYGLGTESTRTKDTDTRGGAHALTSETGRACVLPKVWTTERKQLRIIKSSSSRITSSQELKQMLKFLFMQRMKKSLLLTLI